MRKSMFASVTALIIVLMMVLSTTVVFADSDPNVTIVNPIDGNSAYSTSLLVSVKITTPSTIKVSVYQKQKPSTSDANSTPVAITVADLDKYKADKAAGKETVKFSNKLIMTEEKKTDNNLTFYTKKLEKVTPGVYAVKVDTLDADKKVIYSDTVTVVLKDKETETKSAEQPGATQFLQNLLQNIFGS